MKRILIPLLLIGLSGHPVCSQPAATVMVQGHSHNDYQQERPFTAAYAAGFGSIEADVFLVRDTLWLGHVLADTAAHRSLARLYLDSLSRRIRLNNGYPYTDRSKTLQLLIDCKTAPVPAINKLVDLLNHYPALIQCMGLSIVVSGNRPPSTCWKDYPAFLFFDGNIGTVYSRDALHKIAMMSGDFATFSQWRGQGPLPAADSLTLTKLVNDVHLQRRKIRFWNAPDSPEAWITLVHLGVDWINTDHIPELAAFLTPGLKGPGLH